MLAWTPLFILWAGWIAQAVLMAIHLSQFARAVAKPARQNFDDFCPPVAVIVPFKGHDPDLARHVRALVRLDYPDYRLVFVLEDRDDPARGIIELELQQHEALPRIDWVDAGPATDTTGQKVHNQLSALQHLQQSDDPSVVWVFADSDALPGRHWLSKLVGPHSQPDRVGVSTGYRWLVPELRAQQPRLASAVVSVINSAVACLIAHPRLTQAWGGSMAVRADFARDQGLVDRYLTGAISDDYQMTRMCRDAGRRVYFVPSCLVASPVNFGWQQLLEFGRRQYVITRRHDHKLYFRGVGVVLLYLLSTLTAWASLIYAPLTAEWGLGIVALCTIVVVVVCNQLRAGYRRRVVAIAFGKDQLRYMRHTLWLDRFGTTLVMAVNLVLLLSAAFGRTITWRTKRYRLDGPRNIRRLA